MALPTRQTSIWMALRNHLETLALSPPLAIVFEGELYEPRDEPYLAATLIAAPVERFFIRGGGQHRHSGELVLTLFYPIGQKVEVQREVAGKIAAHFPDDLCLAHSGRTVRITKQADVGGSYRDEGRMVWPISVSWEAYA